MAKWHVADVIAVLEELAAPSLAEAWDNVGLLFGSPEWPVAHVLLALDPTLEVVAQAQRLAAPLIITHHPLIFSPVRSLSLDTPEGAIVHMLAKADIALYAAHTNMDKSPICNSAIALAEALELRPIAAPEDISFYSEAGKSPTQEETIPIEMGCQAKLPQPMAAEAFARYVGSKLGSRVVQLIGIAKTASVERLILVPGAGGVKIAAAAKAHGDAMLTGELKYHEMREAVHKGLPVFLAGHFETERPLLAMLRKILQKRLPSLDIRIAQEHSLGQEIIVIDKIE